MRKRQRNGESEEETTMNEREERSAKEIESLLEAMGWIVERTHSGDVIGRSSPVVLDTEHYGIITFNSVVLLWDTRNWWQPGTVTFQIFHVRREGTTAIWTRKAHIPQRVEQLLRRYGVPMHQADASMQLVPAEEEGLEVTTDTQHRLGLYVNLVRELEAGGWRVRDIKLRLDKAPTLDLQDYVQAYTVFLRDGGMCELGLYLRPVGDAWMYDLKWVYAPPDTPLEAYQVRSAGTILSPEQQPIFSLGLRRHGKRNRGRYVRARAESLEEAGREAPPPPLRQHCGALSPADHARLEPWRHVAAFRGSDPLLAEEQQRNSSYRQ
jgi:hypothetical protein